ncbi:MAG: PEP-CTERM sorting domain-containing protein [Bryobacteraceae bacterium]|nr:PEP-CTERM sorting domain-containing protein [Bryobacteraceae bacterium]
MRRSLRVLSLLSVASISSMADVVFTSRISYYSFENLSDPTFLTSTVFYDVYVRAETTVGPTVTGGPYTLRSGAYDLSIFTESGGTILDVAPDGGFPFVNVDFTPVADGVDYWHLQYRTAPDPDPNVSWISTEITGGYYTMTFGAAAGGFGGGGSGIINDGNPFAVIAYLPGDWSQEGTSTGKREMLSLNPGWTVTKDFEYDAMADLTIFEASVSSYTNPDSLFLGFRLYGGLAPGAAVPEPGTFALLALPVALIALRRLR